MKTESSSDGIGFLGLLTIVFITLKLTGVIHWSWWWVLSPFLIPIAIILSVLSFVVVILLSLLSFLGASWVVRKALR